jgi:hypothetical protein
MRLLAVLVFVVPATYLIEIWPRRAPPTNEQVERAAVEVKNGAYHVSFLSGADFKVSPNVGGPDEARNIVRAQIANERSAFRQSWAEFWFQLAGAFGVAIVLILINRAVRPDTNGPGWKPG